MKTTPGFEDDGDWLHHVWGKRQVATTAFLLARDSDHLMVPFECDSCIFRKLKKREPNHETSDEDRKLLACI